MSRAYLALAALALCAAACFNPDYSKVAYACNLTQPVCPEGHFCDGEKCVLAKDAPDLGGSDASPPPPPDLRPRNGCASLRGAPVGPRAWACPGLFDPGQVRAMCAPGFRICTSAAGVDLPTCRNTTGFFIADVRGYDQLRDCSGDASAVLCSYVRNRERPLWFGCGSLTGFQQNCQRGCSGFVQASNGTIAASIPGPPFLDSFTVDIEDQTNNVSTNGVLCCENQ